MRVYMYACVDSRCHYFLRTVLPIDRGCMNIRTTTREKNKDEKVKILIWMQPIAKSEIFIEDGHVK